jgi:hypothetical protein
MAPEIPRFESIGFLSMELHSKQCLFGPTSVRKYPQIFYWMQRWAIEGVDSIWNSMEAILSKFFIFFMYGFSEENSLRERTEKYIQCNLKKKVDYRLSKNRYRKNYLIT